MIRLTTQTTIGRNVANELGWRELMAQPGEPYLGRLPQRGTTLTALWHISDIHLCDAESPGRQEYLDRYSDPDSPHRDLLGDIGTYRPQEAFTAHVALSAFGTVNAVRAGPVTDRPIDAVLVTGDIIDNAQVNELDWYISLLRGGRLEPWSGSANRSCWVGASDARWWDDRYWHPDGPALGHGLDRPSRVYGFPQIPGLIEAGREALNAPGVDMAVVSVHGNHDGLLQGTVCPDERLRALLLGDQRIVGLAAQDDPAVILESIAGIGPARYLAPGSHIPIIPDGSRAALDPGDFAQALQLPGTNYWGADVGEMRLIVLDTVNPHGGWQGSIDQEQFAWLKAELESLSNQYAIIASHHPSAAMINDYAPEGADLRILGDEVVALLNTQPRVVAWLAGHVHHHSSTWHQGSRGGFWEITTASLIDWPQQARTIEFVREKEHVAIVSTVVDHGAPIDWRHGDLREYPTIAAISRALAANDYRLRQGELRSFLQESWPAARNAIWRVPI